MIDFFADNHYDAHPGRVIFEHLPERLRRRIRFDEDDWRRLETGGWIDDCELVVLHLIGGSCGVAHPGPGAERAMRAWCERGGDLLLLHGASAAFWQWPWWRTIVGRRAGNAAPCRWKKRSVPPTWSATICRTATTTKR